MRNLFIFILALGSLTVFAQTEGAKPGPQPAPSPATGKPAQGPPVKVNYLNVCNPSDEEKKEIAAALERVPRRASFSQDFEVTRGRSSMADAPSARYIRLRREISGNAIFSYVQYSLSTDAEDTIETLVLKLKEPKELFSISLEDQVSAAASAPASVLDVNTPVSRIKLERFGKSNLVLARCPGADQSSYEPLFQQATALLAGYRKSLGLHGMFRMDIAWLSPPKPKASAAKSKPSSAAVAPR